MMLNQLYATNPPSKGNFALNDSQQPGPFFSFGQNIIDKNQFIFFYNPNYSQAPKVIAGTPSLLYGITDSASVLLALPYAFIYESGSQILSGIGDLIINFEYAYYTYQNSNYSDSATIVVSPTFPISHLNNVFALLNSNAGITGNTKNNIPSNLDTYTYFLGTTYSRTFTDWYAFVAPGVMMLQTHNSIQQGTQYIYNVGLGRNIKTVEKKYIFFGLLELNGQYSNKSKFSSNIIPSTGGNLIYATPSLSFATQIFVLQVGVSIPISQYWYGNQTKTSYNAGAIISWSIN